MNQTWPVSSAGLERAVWPVLRCSVGGVVEDHFVMRSSRHEEWSQRVSSAQLMSEGGGE